jgi:hypothetical protein
MTDWFMKLKEDYKLNEQNEALRNRFHILTEGTHNINIDLSTKDKFTKEFKGQSPRTYIIYKTINFDKPYLKLTTFQYGLLLKQISKLPEFENGLIPTIINLLVSVVKGDDDKLVFNMSVIPGDTGDATN